MKRKVWLCQANNTFGSSGGRVQAFLPYSVGILQSYAQADPVIRSEYAFAGFVFSREPIHQVVARMDQPDVVAISAYVWNARYSFALGKAVRESFPNCLIVLGGPHIPNRSDDFFKQHPWADLLIHYEGEEAFRAILLERMNHPGDESCYSQYLTIPGLSVNVGGGLCEKTSQRERMSDLDSIPSPYLAGVFEELYLRHPDHEWHPTQETHRGCPYACTFLRLGQQCHGEGQAVWRRTS